jgi:hypothetical protein
MSRRSSRRGRRPPSRSGSAPRVDLGPVPFTLTVHSIERRVAGRDAGPEEGTGGILSDLQALHSTKFRSTWTLQLGEVELLVNVAKQLDLIESLWVFLLDLVDVGYGEWSVYDGRDMLVFEAQVFGPDIQLELCGEAGMPRFGGALLPRKAMVRLRRFIEQGVAALRLTLEQQKSLDPDFSSLPGLTDFAGELVEMEEAVAELPLEFKQRSSESSPSSVGSLEVL